ncbi:outer membrane beta-barrel protein [Flavobacterium pallidum]|uniref:Outer membrane protein beta-barrel domain-containing protein n=1 Tax=Flavobacterium pallidum TaxID=2172098 RepID=A0A2S1SI34_9FLAO|nr:outer membrane beta-barrel protein [Flavobacterium pallidum]AWI26045.1 hypothetical protein HYN49_09130 [Flavobacterium pallidum]
MKKYLLLLICFPAIAQIEFVPGYFIDNNNKTTTCLVRDEGWKDNPVTFQYKMSAASEAKIGHISEVSAFGVDDGTQFRRFKVDVDQSSNEINALSASKQPEFSEQTLFLKYLVEGDISLLSYDQGNQRRYFIYKKETDTVEQLICKNYLVDATTIAENNYFRQQLFNALKSEQLTQKDFQNLEYRQSSLIPIFEKYYAGSGQTFTSKEKQISKGSLHFSVSGGINFSGVSFESPTVDANTGVHATPGIGVELESVLPFNHNKWSLFVNPNFHRFEYDGSVSNVKLEVDYKAVNIPLGFRHYMFLQKQSRLFIDGGYNIGVTLSSTLKYGGTEFKLEKGSNMFLGFGYNYKKYSIKSRYNFVQGLISSHTWSIGYGSIQLMLSYQIF